MAEYETHFIRTNGINLHVIQAGPSDGKPLILLHGFPEYSGCWHRQIDHLAAQGFRVYAPDQRGYNLSDKPKGIASYHLDVLAKDLIGLIDHTGHEKVSVVGHDWGAGVTWHTALWYPDRFEKIAILNVPHPDVFERELRTNPRQRRKSWYFLFFQTPILPELLLRAGDHSAAARSLMNSSKPGTFTDSDIAGYTAAWGQPGAWTGMINWYRSVVRQRPKLPDDVRVKVPTLILWGAKDAFLEAGMAQKSIDLCEAGRLELFDDATHWIHLEEPARVNALLTEWFSL